VTVDDEHVWEHPGTLAAVANTGWFGGGLRIAPDATVEDGLLDVVLADALTVRQTLGLFPRLYGGSHVRDPRVHVRRARTVLLEAVPGLGVHPPVAYADGERIGPLPLRVEVVPGALAVLV